MSQNLMAVKVMTFNIASGKKLDGVQDLELVASVIEQSGVDIAGLQEVDQHFSERSGFRDQVSWLEERLGMFAVYGPNISKEPDGKRHPSRQFGNAVLSKYPILTFHNHRLTEVPVEGQSSEPRGLLEAIVEKDGTQFAFFNMHLSLKDEELEVNIEELIRISIEKDVPVILAGDFNADPHSSHMEKMRKYFTDVFGPTENHPPTYKKRGDHGEKIDFIFHGRHWGVLSAEVVKMGASDHYPIVAELQLFTNT